MLVYANFYLVTLWYTDRVDLATRKPDSSALQI